MKIKISLLFAALLILGGYQTIRAVIGEPGRIKEHIASAEKYETKEIYEDALEEYRAAVDLGVKDSRIKRKVAEMQLKLEDVSGFINTCETLIGEKQMDTQALQMLIDFYVSDGNTKEAVFLLKKLREEKRDNETVEELWNCYRGYYEEEINSYDDISPFYQGYSIAEYEGRFGLLNDEGETVIPVGYEKMGLMSEEYLVVPVCENGTWYYMNAKMHKKIVPDEEYDYLGVISENIAVVMKSGKYGFADSELVPKTELKWENATNLRQGIAAVKLNGKWGLVDDSLQMVTDYAYEDIAVSENGFCCGQERIFAKSKDGYQMLDKKGKTVGNGIYEDARPFETDSLTAVKKSGKWGFVNTSDELAIDCEYEDARSFTNGLAAVKKNGKWGYINTANEIVVEPVFEDARPFGKNGLAPVKKEYWYFIHLYAIAP